jgi:hypothetical protein
VSARRALYGLLAVVAAAAAVLSFAALRDLALLCGFAPQLAPLLPVVVDAGAAAGSLVWLGGAVAEQARRFGRVLAVALLAASVAGNAVAHGLDAYAARPAWWLVVAVSAVAPAVLGAVVHLSVLAAHRHTAPAESGVDGLDDEARYDEVLDEQGLSRLWADAPLVADPDDVDEAGDGPPVGDRAAELIADGAGRRRLARELDVSEYEARRLLAGRRNGHRAVTR